MSDRLHPDDIEAIARAVADEIERRRPRQTFHVDSENVCQSVSQANLIAAVEQCEAAAVADVLRSLRAGGQAGRVA